MGRPRKDPLEQGPGAERSSRERPQPEPQGQGSGNQNQASPPKQLWSAKVQQCWWLVPVVAGDQSGWLLVRRGSFAH